LFVDPRRKLLNVYINRPDLHHVLPPLQTQTFLQPDHNAAREMRLLPNVFNGTGQILHQVGKFLKITGDFHFFLQPYLLHQLSDDLVEPTIILFKHRNSFFVIIRKLDHSHTILSQIQETLSLSKKSQSLVVLLNVMMKIVHSFTSPENFGMSMPRTCRAMGLETSLRCVLSPTLTLRHPSNH
jgi:hypothetical protein